MVVLDLAAQCGEELVFRLCPGCGAVNVIKDAEFVCALCDAPLERGAGWDGGSGGGRAGAVVAVPDGWSTG
ncbi:hypothetical protein GCM10009738_24770 [Kitasatospora viridis]